MAALVRTRMHPVHREHRSLEDKLALLAPRLFRRLNAAVLRLPLSSRLRSTLIARALSSGLAAGTRLDYERLLAGCAPDYEIHVDYPGWAAIDMERVYYGTDGLRQLVEDLRSGFREVRWEPRELLDAGGSCFAVRLDSVGVGHGSGAETRQEQWHVYLAEHGLIRSQRVVST